MTIDPRGRLRGASGAALVVVALITIAWLLLSSPLFRIAAIEVDGNAQLSDRELRELSGARIGDNLVFLSTRDVERALESSPWIADADVARRLPNSLVIGVAERRAVAVADDATTTFVIGADGIVLGEADAPGALPSLGRYGHLIEGEPLPGSLAPVRVLASLPSSVTRVVDAAELEPDGVVVRFARGGYATFGPATDTRRKAAALEGVLAWAEDRGVVFRYIDVRVPESPVLRPKGRGTRSVHPEITPAPRG
ncbi:MAG TPA: FtsQ-type POTRA domain-containing protein [Actinomycetota bacterium]|nr:FtsQ-type POTRA domain-containing protein [Actinomycetota bacterium]